MTSAMNLLLLKYAHAQLHAEILQGIAADLQRASTVLNTRARNLDAHFLSLKSTHDKGSVDPIRSSEPATEKDILEVTNAMASIEAMTEIQEQMRRNIEALIGMECKPGLTEHNDARVYVNWKNSTREQDFNFGEAMSEKLAEISSLSGIKLSLPVTPAHPKVRSAENPTHKCSKLTSQIQIVIPATTSPAALSPNNDGLTSASRASAPKPPRSRTNSVLSPPPTPGKQTPHKSVKRKQRMADIKKAAASPEKVMASSGRPVWGVFRGSIKTEEED
ncbi:hypothetical protein LTR84_012172 [Exophiala bonariae]|uniref:Uncharacterized protein n=1 Tax=Exophiala bonariae TaxID=1690606 RepID=A0AAV9NFL9_9EURO|nr:hypothetical protein LTR84_012172 [Exophiala bonariae]